MNYYASICLDIGVRFGNVFARNGIRTSSELKQLIEKNGLIELSDGTYFFGNEKGVMGAGKKTWEVALSFLESDGFDWKKFIVSSRYFRPGFQPDTELEYKISINLKIVQLIKLLEEYNILYGLKKQNE